VLVSAVLTGLYPALQASDAATLDFWTDTELAAFAREALDRLAYAAACWTDAQFIPAQIAPTAALDPPVVAVAAVTFGGYSLVQTSVAQLEAFSRTWASDVAPSGGRPRNWLQEAREVRIYPAPSAPGVLAIDYVSVSPVTAFAPGDDAGAPEVCGDYLRAAVLGEARAKETEGAMQDVAAWQRSQAALYARAFTALYGGAVL
jgi:hypothetical protein